jgi:hypothetical protein
MEKEALNRLAGAREYAFHPLLLPGIFAELERERMVKIVESTIDRLEETIYELDTGSSLGDACRSTPESGHPAGARYVRRTVWLNVTFLRNRLRIWRTQLLKMTEHVEELLVRDCLSSLDAEDEDWDDIAHHHRVAQNADSSMHRTGRLIKDRLGDLGEELDEMIDDCSMRVDGMTIATQWVRRI